MKTLIAPSILSFDMSTLAHSVAELEAGGADLIHFDVMDGQFVPPITFGAGMAESLRKKSKLPFEAHLMTLTPEAHFDAFQEAGCETIIFHAEVTHHAHRLCMNLHNRGLKAGIAINPATPVEAVRDLLDIADLVLIMTINPGWGGQELLPFTLDKVRQVREWAPNIDIEVDGGMKDHTIGQAKAAGANMFVAGSYLTGPEGIPALVRKLREACD